MTADYLLKKEKIIHQRQAMIILHHLLHIQFAVHNVSGWRVFFNNSNVRIKCFNKLKEMN